MIKGKQYTGQSSLKVTILLLAMFLLAWLLLPSFSLAAEGMRLTINQVDDSAYPQVRVFTTVSDEEGIPLTGLDESAFRLFQDGVELDNVSVAPVEDSNEGIAVILAIDTSGSMNEKDTSGQSALDAAKDAALTSIDNLDPANDQVALIAFSDSVRVLQPFTNDKAVLVDVINNLSAGGETRLNDAAFEGAKMAGTLLPGRKAFILLTDGQDTNSALLAGDAIDRSRENDVPIYTIGVGPSIDARALERMSTLTGGRYLEAPQIDDIGASFATIADQLREQYLVSFEGDVAADGGEHNLRLEVTHLGATAEDSRTFVARPNPVAVSILLPSNGQEVAGIQTITTEITAPGQTVEAALYVDGQEVGVETAEPFAFTWDSSGSDIGDHLLLVEAQDHVGNVGEASVMVNVVPALDIRFDSPADAAEIVDTARLVAAVSDGLYGVTDVSFLVNGDLLQSFSSPPYETNWEIDRLTAGLYSLTARVRDSEGNEAEDSIQVQVTPPPPLQLSLISPVEGDMVQESVAAEMEVIHTFDIDRLEFLVNGEIVASQSSSPFAVDLDVTGITPGSYIFTARAHDMEGNQAEESINIMVLRPSFPWVVVLVLGMILAIILVVVAVWLNHRRNAAQAASVPPPPPPADPRSTIDLDDMGAEPVSPIIPAAEFGSPSTSSAASDSYAVKSTVGSAAAAGTVKAANEYDATMVDGPDTPMALVIVSDPTSGKSRNYTLGSGEIIVGRGTAADIVVTDAHASRKHAKIRQEEGKFVYYDLSPENPSIINGQEYSQAHVLQDGDELLVGDTRLIFKVVV